MNGHPGTVAGPIGSIVLMASINRASSPAVPGLYPFAIPAERAFIRSATDGAPILMGRRVFEAHGPRPGRVNFVLTRQGKYQAEDSYVIHSAATFVRLAREFPSVYVLGGLETLWSFAPYAGRILLAEYADDTVTWRHDPARDGRGSADRPVPFADRPHPLASLVSVAKRDWSSFVVRSRHSDRIGVAVEFWSMTNPRAADVHPSDPGRYRLACESQ